MYKGSEKYFRIAEPVPSVEQNVTFVLEENENLDVFNITESGGIVYVKDAELLKNVTQTQVT